MGKRKKNTPTVTAPAEGETPETTEFVPEVETPAPEVTTPVPEAEPPAVAPPKALLSPVPLRVFEQVCGRKPDQMAGFKHFARTKTPRTIPEWHTLYAEFLARPI